GEELLYLDGVGDVERRRLHRGGGSRCGLGEGGLVAAGGDHPVAVGGHPVDDRPADAAASSRHYAQAGSGHGGEVVEPPVAAGRVDRGFVAPRARAGLLPRLYPPEGLSAMDLCLIRQGVARANTEAETAFAMQGLGSYPIYQSARPEVRDRWIPAVSRGEVVP